PSSVIHLTILLTDNDPPKICTLSLHDALPISRVSRANSQRSTGTRPVTNIKDACARGTDRQILKETYCATSRMRCSSLRTGSSRSEEHTSELQSPCNLVCRLLLEKKKNKQRKH